MQDLTTRRICFKSDPEKPKSYNSYLDANNLYGGAMSQALPIGGFKFVDEDEKRSKFPVADMNTVLSSLADDDDIGYILDVNLEYQKALHASHSDYPLAPESLEILNDMLPPPQKAKFPNEPPQLKLIPNLRDK